MELISKEYLLKAFGAFNDEEHAPEGWMSAMRTAREIVDDAPTVDAVPVVRCEECIHNHVEQDKPECRFTDLVRSNKFYCRFGERKSE